MKQISSQRLKELERTEKKLQALEAGGVDNWENYDDSLEAYHAEHELEEQMEGLLDDLSCIFGECAYEPSERGGGIAFRGEAYEQALKLLRTLKVRFG